MRKVVKANSSYIVHKVTENYNTILNKVSDELSDCGLELSSWDNQSDWETRQTIILLISSSDGTDGRLYIDRSGAVDVDIDGDVLYDDARIELEESIQTAIAPYFTHGVDGATFTQNKRIQATKGTPDDFLNALDDRIASLTGGVTSARSIKANSMDSEFCLETAHQDAMDMIKYGSVGDLHSDKFYIHQDDVGTLKCNIEDGKLYCRWVGENELATFCEDNNSFRQFLYRLNGTGSQLRAQGDGTYNVNAGLLGDDFVSSDKIVMVVSDRNQFDENGNSLEKMNSTEFDVYDGGEKMPCLRIGGTEFNKPELVGKAFKGREDSLGFYHVVFKNGKPVPADADGLSGSLATL